MRSTAMNRDLRRWGRLALCVCAWAAAGCQLAQNPFRDEFAGEPPVVTPTVAGIQEAAAEPEYRMRAFDEREAVAANGTVSHFPLFFEDLWDEKALRHDDRFAWEAEDWVNWLQWRGRFLVNLVGFPVSCFTTPPWAAMDSDGRPGSRSVLSQQYDAELQ